MGCGMCVPLAVLTHCLNPVSPASRTYAHPCRCSGVFVVTEGDLEAGRDLATCSLCTLAIRVVYTTVADE